MISFSTELFDLDGFVIFNTAVSIDSDTITRRVNSTPTLDGASFITDAGYSATDRAFGYSIVGQSKSVVDNVVRIAKYHSRLVLCNEEGAFTVIIKSVFYRDGKLKINFISAGVA